ncbi:VirB4 family type IV secretion/conjugal transfer ATPase [Xanthomonas campestris pv. raphani]|uniref:VirB4 family type IV secretion/conjugal transfer ATPase n=1 Tax=Xanthomonas campestris TaxID=339 RepID=UPI002B23741A|nr:VirB4 family type IV secretion/conjugal transfer ATPase [Xanthomonas campestris]MEA9776962.1 VirB4 family type IV secretion/conjugal transfer ATPase [Xanthomonas campestris pv. raphani]
MTNLSLHRLLGREKSLSERIPYSVHVSPENIRTTTGDVLTIIRLEGVAHESADLDDIELWHESLNGMLKSIADPSVALWRHTVRRERNGFPGGEFKAGFSQDLNEHYRQVVGEERMMVNDLYISVVVKGPPKVNSFFDKKTISAEHVANEIAEQSAKLDEITRNVMEALDRYSPTRLSLYKRPRPGIQTEDNPRPYSEPLEFLSFLVNGEWQPVPAPRQRISYAIPTSRITFGVETGEVRNPTSAQLFAILSANEYPEETETGVLNALLSLPFEFVLTHSFAYVDKLKAQKMIGSQRNKLVKAGDAAGSQIMALEEAEDDLASNRISFGEHHLSLCIKANDQETLIRRVAQARSNMSDSNFIVAREDLALEAAYWAQLPGNFKDRPRPAPITTRNFAGLVAMHNYPQGKADNNQWGPALTLLKTTSGTPYYFNLHLPTKGKRASGKQTDDERVAGNTLIIGPTGAGKTVIQTFLLSQAEKYQPTVFTFDKDYGQEIFIRASGGNYSILQNGHPTGFNPLQMEDNPSNRLFLENLIAKLAGPTDRAMTAEEESILSAAVRGVMEMPVPMRRFTALRSFLPPTQENSMHARLLKWCEGQSLGWVLDSPSDSLSLEGTRYFGFDVTDFLDNDQVRTPVVMYLFHRMEQLIDGRPFILNMDEFWKMLLDPYFENKANDVVKTIRKRNGLAIFGTQSPKDVLKSAISHSLIEQCVTKLFLPNPSAEESQYTEGFKLTKREYDIVKSDMPAQNLRGFLCKQGRSSTVCELNLAGFDNELAVLSGTSTSVAIARRAIAQAGPDPQEWLPIFHDMRKRA